MYPNLTVCTAPSASHTKQIQLWTLCPHVPWQDKSTTTTPPRKAAFESATRQRSFVMSFPHRKAMNRCWPPQTNPTEPERGTTRTHKQQAVSPPARAPTPPTPHT
jgi:hypothetical protein